MNILNAIDGDSNAFTEAIYGWGEALEQVNDGQRIRVTWKGRKPKTGYAYLEDCHTPGIRLTHTTASRGESFAVSGL